ncbi:nucleoside-diphosphate sugar epimerase/dehydratase [Coraliomargarita sinensis]|uniref:nucleoside-diphosphate sugar epimerase/dehydratase n=1 Tax=Coraliomargarita sinensis TaxID=2174842 RepID=UPI001304CD27|nr:nucleoside-diphosphate sugar epimerase/dehydratase [Coraliomargarita sinensis]
MRFDFGIDLHPQHAMDRINTIWWVVGLQLMLLYAGGQVDSILSYFRLPDAMRLFAALFANCLILLSMWYLYGGKNVPPRAVILTYFLLSFLAIAAFRILMRVKSSRGPEDWLSVDTADNVVIIGAGEVGAGLCAELMSKARLGMRPVAFLDDDSRKVGRYIHGLLVADTVDEVAKVAKRYSANKAVIAFPSASVKRMREVAELARQAGLKVDTVPALTDLVSGRAQVSQLRPVQLEDLLGRDPVNLNSGDIRDMLKGKRVLVTGAGGSIGKELVAQILTYAPSEMLCLDQAEIAIFELEQEIFLKEAECKVDVRTCVADVYNTEVLRARFEDFQPEVVFHAAAHKHVNLMEVQPDEALRNNFLATTCLARLASEFKVERFVMISTDKAINPTSVMGASKRLAELSVTAQQHAEGNVTKFMSVRFGNVLGSSGSVITIFRRQIAAGGPVTVTDPEVKRFFMTVKEAVGLVLQSATQGEGGEIFVLDMGEAVKIDDLARQMIQLSGCRPGEDIEIIYTGLRPGEKRFEEVQHISEKLQKTRHPRVLRFVADRNGLDFEHMEKELASIAAGRNAPAIKATIQKFVPEYTPSEDQ